MIFRFFLFFIFRSCVIFFFRLFVSFLFPFAVLLPHYSVETNPQKPVVYNDPNKCYRLRHIMCEANQIFFLTFFRWHLARFIYQKICERACVCVLLYFAPMLQIKRTFSAGNMRFRHAVLTSNPSFVVIVNCRLAVRQHLPSTVVQPTDVLPTKMMSYQKCNRMLYHPKFGNGWHRHSHDN